MNNEYLCDPSILDVLSVSLLVSMYPTFMILWFAQSDKT